MGEEYRLDELARRAGVASTTVRLYQTKGLLAPPRLEGRTGWYGEAHLDRLQLIARLQDEGHSLAGIAALLEQWERGAGLDAVIGAEAELNALLGDAHAVELEPADLLARFAPGGMTPDLMQRGAALGLVTPTNDGRIRVNDRRFIDSGAGLTHLGVPVDVILDEWEALVRNTDDIAERFIALFEEHLIPTDRPEELGEEQVRALGTTLAQLRSIAHQVVAAALDASIARIGRERLGELVQS